MRAAAPSGPPLRSPRRPTFVFSENCVNAVIDAHTHTECPNVDEMVADALEAAGPNAIPYERDLSPESRARDLDHHRELGDKFYSIERRLADMARMCLARQVIVPSPRQQHYWAQPGLLARISATQNDHIADMVAMIPERFVGVGTLPLTDPKAAIFEAHRAASLGLRAFQIDARAGEWELSAPQLDPVYEALADLGLGLIIHPLGFTHGERFTPFYMVNSVAQPLEELIAFHHLVFGGVLDRHPTLKVLLAHGGGFAPFYIGRYDHTWKVRPEVHALIPEPPSTYLKRLYFDTCVFRSDHVATLVDLVGADRVMLGSDYPYDISDRDPLGTLDGAGLSPFDRERIVEGTAAEFFAL